MAQRNRLAVDARSLLSCIPLFAGLPPDRLDRLGAACRLIELPGHRSLFAAGQPIREIHYLITGTVKRFTMRADSLEKVLELVSAGSPVGLAEALAADEHVSFAETLERCTVLALGRDALRAELAEDGLLANRLLALLVRQQHSTEFAVIRHHSLPVTQRVLDYLLKLAGESRQLAGETTVRLGASKRLVAASLDMAPETFSRTLRQLSDDGIVVVEGRQVHIQHAALVAVESSGRATVSPPVRYARQERGVPPDAPAAVEMINLCGRHRMLSQRMAAAWVLAQRGVDAHAARAGLKRFGEDFQRNLRRTSLLPLSAPVRENLRRLETEWAAYRAVIGPDLAAAALPQAVFDGSERMLEFADRLTASAVAAASSAEARRVEFAARNRMLCARITKLWLFADWQVAAGHAWHLIEDSAREFEENLGRLHQAMASLPEAEAQLAIDAEQWKRFRARIRRRDDDGGSAATVRGVCSVSDALLRQVDATVKLCERMAIHAA